MGDQRSAEGDVALPVDPLTTSLWERRARHAACATTMRDEQLGAVAHRHDNAILAVNLNRDEIEPARRRYGADDGAGAAQDRLTDVIFAVESRRIRLEGAGATAERLSPHRALPGAREASDLPTSV